MKNKPSCSKKSNFTIAASLIFASTLTVGCSTSSAPTESDLNDQFKQIFKDCSNITISELKKVNGVAQDEKRHLVSTSFTIRVTPLAENEKQLTELNLRHTELEKKYQEYESLVNEVNTVFKDLSQKKGALRASQLDEDKIDATPEIAALSARHNALRDQLDEATKTRNEYLSYDNKKQSLKNELAQNFFKQCKVPNSQFLLQLLLQTLNSPETFGKVTERQLKADIPMIKTDNGWKMEEFWGK